MRSTFKASLLAGASAVAISLMAASPASAFDTVNWTWNANLDEQINKNVNININMTPTGMVMLEDLQVMIGDVKATSDVHSIYNNQPQQGGTVDLGTQDITFQYGIGGDLLDNGNQSPSVIAGHVDETDQEPNINGTVTATLDLGQVDIPASGSYDALTELPSVVSAATAVANNTNISTDSSVQLHEGQFAFGNGSIDSSSPFVPGVNTTNSNLTAADVLGAMALSGGINSSTIKAKSNVYDILNATVDSSATAVANNLSVSVAPTSGQDSLVIGDVVQFAVADVTATSKVHDVTLNNYTNLGSLSGPIVNSVATAVGNNKSITVVTPTVGPAL